MLSTLLRGVAVAALAGVVLTTTPTPILAQAGYYFPVASVSDLDPAIPSPERFLGYPIGSRYTRHDRVVEYLRELDRLSDRITVREIGRSYEDRPLLEVLITSEANQAQIETLKAAHACDADPSAPADPAAPVVVGLYYGVHGNETSSGEAALLTAYYLVAGRDEETRAWLDKAVILIDPVQNPDGRDRAANWHNAWASNPPISDPADKEHVEPFPAGRTNHYFTDLNRDWLAVTQQETAAKLEVFHQWRPNVQIDFHEMGAGSTYYFEPSPASMESPLLPQASYEANVVLARYHAQALDGLGWLYYTKENFDNFSPVYGSTYPDFHGGVGVTVEQASSRGLVQDTDSGPLEFRFTIRNQTAVGLATIRGAVEQRNYLRNLQREFFRSAVEQGRRHEHAAFVFGDPANPGLTAQTLELLQRHHIRVNRLASAVTIDGRTFRPDSAYVVVSAQPQFRLVHSIFEPTPEVKRSVYGSTSYGIADAYGLAVGRARRAPPLGEVVTAVPRHVGGVKGTESAYAYAIDSRDLNAPAVLSALLKEGVVVRTAFQPFTARTAEGETAFERGSLIVTASGQTQDAAALRALVDAAARQAGVDAWSLGTGQSVAGVDLGSDSVRRIRAPKIALIMGQGVNATEIGSTWFALSERLAWPATRLDPAQIGTVRLDDYTSIVLAGGSYEDWNDRRVAALKAWIEGGGSLVTYGSASAWAIEKGLAKSTAEPGDKADAPASSAVRRDFADRRDYLSEQRTSGNALSADVDVTHPHAFGLSGRSLVVNKETDIVLRPVDDPFANVVRIEDRPRVNGYLSEDLKKAAAGSIWAQTVRAGRGNVVLFADDPAHRKYWLGTERLLINALFLSNYLTPSERR